MATQNESFDDADDHDEYLTAQKVDEALLDWKLKEMQQKNREIRKRHAEVEADRKAAEDSGCAVTLRSNNAGYSSKEKSNERPVEDEMRGRGRGQAWGRRRPRGPRTRPHGHFAQGSHRDNSAAESLHNNDSDRSVATGFDQSSDQVSYSPCDFDTSQPPEGSHLFPHNSSQPQYSGQESGEGHRGQRSAGGRGHSRPKYVTVPDASHSHDVRHVEQVNNSIVINIDRSAKPAPEPTRRGRGGRGGERGSGARSDFSAGIPDDDAGSQSVDRDGVAHGAPNRSGYRGQGGRRPFRGQGEGSYRGQGRGDGGYRRARGDGPRPFRGGYRGDRARGGRGARRAMIHVSTASSESAAAGSAGAQEEEDWDRDVSGDAGDSAALAGDGELGGEDNGAASLQEGCQIPDETEDGGAGHFFEGSLASGVDDHEDGVDVSHSHESRALEELDAGEKMDHVLEKKEIEQNIETAESKQQLVTGVEGCDTETKSKALAVDLEGVKSEESVERKQDLAESVKADVKTAVADVKVAKADVKVDAVKDASCSNESCTDQVVGKASKDASDETVETSKKAEPEKSSDQLTNATGQNPSTASDSDKLKTSPPASAEIPNSSVPTTASDKNSPVLSSDVVSEIPTASVDKET